MDVIRNIEAPHLKQDVPEFGPGDTVRVRVRVVEGEKVRQQAFQGVVIARCHSGTGETFTVRKVTDGVGIERIFPLHSPNVEGIEVVRRGRVRRAKLTYLRGRTGKSARIREKARMVDLEAQPPSQGKAEGGQPSEA
jgi:large subunit ribosomal protein L19